jgi:hypothetical protein
LRQSPEEKSEPRSSGKQKLLLFSVPEKGTPLLQITAWLARWLQKKCAVGGASRASSR